MDVAADPTPITGSASAAPAICRAHRRGNGLFDEKAFSWTLAMEDLETVLPGGVQVTPLEPSRSKDGHITLRMHVIGPRDKDVELVRNLEHSRRFLQPRIVGESSDTNGTPGEK